MSDAEWNRRGMVPEFARAEVALALPGRGVQNRGYYLWIENVAISDCGLRYPQLIERAALWQPELARIKADNPPQDFTWYGYDILSNLWHIEGLLGESHANLLESVQGQPLADIGAADGDLAYFFERQGFDVDVLDWPATNWNGLRGARRLHELLGSSIGIHEVDLDSQFDLPRQRYGLVFLLGILYHLKNPFYVLETLAKHTRYCILSTRIARHRRWRGGIGARAAGLPAGSHRMQQRPYELLDFLDGGPGSACRSLWLGRSRPATGRRYGGFGSLLA